MATNNSVNVGLSGSTGTGNFVGSTSPTLTTPTLGAANATSINFGGSSLNRYNTLTTWTPVVTFATPGDISVAYTNQLGYYSVIGNRVFCEFLISFTPTYTTAASFITVTGLPFTQNSSSLYTSFGTGSVVASTWPAGRTMINFQCQGGTLFYVGAVGAGVTQSLLTTTNFPTAVAADIRGSLCYST